MKKTIALLTSLFHASLDNSRHQVKTLYTEDLASKIGEACTEVRDTFNEIKRVAIAEKEEFLDFQKFYETSLINFAKFMQDQIEKKFNEADNKKKETLKKEIETQAREEYDEYSRDDPDGPYCYEDFLERVASLKDPNFFKKDPKKPESNGHDNVVDLFPKD